MTKSYKLNRHRDTEDGRVNFCSYLFHKVFPQLKMQENVTLTVSTKRLHTKGALKVTFSRRFERGQRVTINGTEIQILNDTFDNIEKDMGGFTKFELWIHAK